MTVKSLSRTPTLLLSLMSSLSLSTTLPHTAQAATPTCDEVLNSCDAALKAKQRELDLSTLGIQIRQDEMVRLQKQNTQLLEKGASWYENPAVWAALGVIAGAYIGAKATK